MIEDEFVGRIPTEIAREFIKETAGEASSNIKIESQGSQITVLPFYDTRDFGSLVRGDAPTRSFTIHYETDWHGVSSPNEDGLRIILSDKASIMQIDVIRFPIAKILDIISNYYQDHYADTPNIVIDENNLRMIYASKPWQINNAIGHYYLESIVKSDMSVTSSGSGISIKPDNSEHAFFATNYESKDRTEWIIAWIKRESMDQIVGVYASFKGDYPMEKIEWRGSSREYYIPEPLYMLLKSIEMKYSN